jgi:hypothetical protein
MMPAPQSDYFARSLAAQIINLQERMWKDYHRMVAEGRPEMAEQCVRHWREQVFEACHEMNQAANDTVTKLQAELTRMMMSMPTPPMIFDKEPKA